jgi:hypothetical protein
MRIKQLKSKPVVVRILSCGSRGQGVVSCIVKESVEFLDLPAILVQSDNGLV